VRLRKIGALWAIILILASCGQQPADLRIANGDDPAVLDPLLASSAGELRIAGALYAGLTRLHPESLAPQPGLAEKFSTTADSRTWTFKLRNDLHWSDGTPLTVNDIFHSWKRLQNPATGSPYQSWLQNAQWESVDENTLQISFPNPRPQFAEQCAFPALAIAPGNLNLGTQFSGPFRLVSWHIRNRVRVIKNPNYWDAEQVQLQSLEFLTIESQFTALNLYLAGDISYTPNVPALAVKPLLEKHADSFSPAPQFATYFLRINTKHPPLDQLEIRQALAQSIRKVHLAKAVGGGRTAANSLVPPLIPGYPSPPTLGIHSNGPIPATTGVVRPKGESLSSNRWENLRLEYLYNSSELNRDVAEVLQGEWKRFLNLDLSLSNQEWKTFIAAQRSGEYQISRSSWIGDYLDPMSFLEIFQGNHPNNRTGWEDEQFDALIAKAKSVSDSALRMKYLALAEQRLLEQAPIIPLFFEASQELISPRLGGIFRNPLGYIDWGQVYWKSKP